MANKESTLKDAELQSLYTKIEPSEHALLVERCRSMNKLPHKQYFHGAIVLLNRLPDLAVSIASTFGPGHPDFDRLVATLNAALGTSSKKRQRRA